MHCPTLTSVHLFFSYTSYCHLAARKESSNNVKAYFVCKMRAAADARLLTPFHYFSFFFNSSLFFCLFITSCIPVRISSKLMVGKREMKQDLKQKMALTSDTLAFFSFSKCFCLSTHLISFGFSFFLVFLRHGAKALLYRPVVPFLSYYSVFFLLFFCLHWPLDSASLLFESALKKKIVHTPLKHKLFTYLTFSSPRFASLFPWLIPSV